MIDTTNLEIVQEIEPYTTLKNIVLQNLLNGFALGVWCYLRSLPSGWIVNRVHLMKHFGVGRDKISKIITFLVKCKLLSYTYLRDEKGRISRVLIHIKAGSEFAENIKNHKPNNDKNKKNSNTPSTTRKIHAVVSQLSGKSAPINKLLFKNKNKKIKKDAYAKKEKDQDQRPSVREQTTSYNPDRKPRHPLPPDSPLAKHMQAKGIHDPWANPHCESHAKLLL